MPASPDAPGFIALEGGDARLEVVPQLGGRIRSLHLFGREWLLAGGPGTEPRANALLLAGAGWDECAPSAGGGRVPDWVKGYGGAVLPYGGEARLLPPETRISTDADGHQVTCTWRGTVLPWVLTRTLLVRPDGVVEARYEVLTTGSHRIPFLWSALLLLPLGAGTRLRLPEGARFRVASLGRATPTGRPSDVQGQWPRLTLDGEARDLSRPWDVPRQMVVSGWLDVGPGKALLQVQEGEERLTIGVDGAQVPFCGVVIDRGGRESGRSIAGPFRHKGQPVLALRPSLGAPDRHADALGDWQSVTWVAPGEPRRWTLTIRGGA